MLASRDTDTRDPWFNSRGGAMADRLSKSQRSRLMAKVQRSGSRPEWIVRCALHRLGFRFRLNSRNLPGHPDLVLAKYRSVIFVHGCFWHRHTGCKDASTPASNSPFWSKKFLENVQRDARVATALRDQGWKVIVVWECELCRDLRETLERVICELNGCSHMPVVFRGRLKSVQIAHVLAAAEAKVATRLRKVEHQFGEGTLKT